MPDHPESNAHAGLNKTRLVAAALEVGAALVTVATLAGMIVWLAVVTRGTLPSVTEFIRAAGLALAGVASGLMLWGLAEIVRQLETRPLPGDPEAFAEGLTPAGESSTTRPTRSAGGPAGVSGGAALDELIALMREVRDISLLNGEQRAKRLEVQRAELARRLEQEVPALLREHKWVEARDRVHGARERFPTFQQWATLEQQIEATRAVVEERDVEAATRQIHDLAALSAWGRAMDVVRDLLDRHPASEAADDLSRHVLAEREKAEAQQRARLMAQAQAAADHRDWLDALIAANTLIEKFPRSVEAEALRQQLPTLKENAEIQTRHRLESEIRDLVKAQRFAEAVRLAREVIGRYPTSPQAAVLRDQLPRLEQKAVALEEMTT